MLDATIFGFTAWRICLSGVLVLSYFALRFHWSREAARRETAVAERTGDRAPVAANGDLTNPGKSLGKKNSWRARDKQASMSMTDTQRIDHLHRSLTLQVNERADLPDLTFGRLPQLCIAFAGIEHASGREYARIKLEIGRALAEAGNGVEQVGDNEFLMPRGAYGDQHSTVHYTCNNGDAVSFLEMRVANIDIEKKSVTVDITHVRGRRAA